MPLDSAPLASEQPVRFYKFIALTFLFITLALVGTIIFMSSKRASITIITKSEPLEVTDTVEIRSGDPSALVRGVVTTTVIEYEKIFSPEGSRSEDAIAVGQVTLVNDTNAAQPLIATTRLLSKEGILFRLKDAITVPAQGSIAAAVYADVAGESGNIATTTFTIPGLSEDKQKVIYAKSTQEMSGGVRTIGVVDADDVEKAEKTALEEMKARGATALEGFAGEGMVGIFDIVQYTFDDVADIGKEVDAFTVKGRATIAGIWYDEAAAKSFAEDMLTKRVVDNSEILSSVEPNPSISLEGYDLEAGEIQLTISHRGLVNIDENSRELDKSSFFGKSEDEVKRYVMSLKHVEGVEMSFKPLWNRSVPHVANNVEITVREIQ